MRRLQLQHFRLQQNGFQQLIDALAGMGRHIHKHGVATPLFRDYLFLTKLVFDPIRIRFRFVDFVHRDDQRHTCRLGVLDCFSGLRHHTIIGRHNQHHNIGHFRATRAHRGKGGVSRGIQKCNFTIIRGDVIRTNVLGNTT